MQRIIYEQDDGTVAIVVPSPKWDGTMEELAEQVVPKDKPWQIVPTEQIPADRTFRNAWKSDLSVDMPKAREIKKTTIRAERTALFTKNDLAIQDAMILQDQEALNKAVATRDALRNATADPAIEAARTPEELKAVRPVVLDTKDAAVVKEVKP